MKEIAIMPEGIIYAGEEISKLLLNDSPGNVRERIRLWTCNSSPTSRNLHPKINGKV